MGRQSGRAGCLVSGKFIGKTMDRPGWNKLANDIEAGKIRKWLAGSRPAGTDRQGTDRSV